MWLLNKISCEIQILNEKVGKLMIENGKLEEENKKLKKECEENDYLVEDNARWIRECGEKTMEIKKLKEELDYYKRKCDFLNKVVVKYQEED